MNRIRRVLPLFYIVVVEVCEIGCESVSVQEQNVVDVDAPDRVVETIVVLDEAGVLWFSRFVERIVTGDPFVVFIVGGELFPKPDDPVLVVLVVPEVGNVPSVVGVPVRVLTSRGGVQIKNCVNAVSGTEVYHSIKVPESLFLENSRVPVI